ncbi:MAG: lipid-binding protein [Fermentimonas sp.]|nr:lipid-binding protein [Fermentimonas sp.]
MKIKLFLLGLAALGIFASCERNIESGELSDISAAAVDVNGQWEVTAHNDSTAIFGPFTVLTTSNPEAKNDSITINDSEGMFWQFQVKAAVNEKIGTFETKLSDCELCEEGVGIKIANGRIINSDSIYFEIQFEDDVTPFGNTYRLKGHRVK